MLNKLGNGSYDAIYRVDSIGTEPVTVSVMLDGQMLPGCPLRPRIIPYALENPHCYLI